MHAQIMSDVSEADLMHCEIGTFRLVPSCTQFDASHCRLNDRTELVAALK